MNTAICKILKFCSRTGSVYRLVWRSNDNPQHVSVYLGIGDGWKSQGVMPYDEIDYCLGRCRDQKGRQVAAYAYREYEGTLLEPGYSWKAVSREDWTPAV